MRPLIVLLCLAVALAAAGPSKKRENRRRDRPGRGRPDRGNNNNNDEDTDLDLNEEEFEEKFNILVDTDASREAAAEALKQAESAIRRQRRRNRAGLSKFRERLYPWSNLPGRDFAHQMGGLVHDPKSSEENVTNTELRADSGFAFGLIEGPEDDRSDPRAEQYFAELAERGDYPTTYDARKYGLISSVKSQGSCGSCAAFAATSIIETCMYKARGATGDIPNLSEQYLLDCGYEYYKQQGGFQYANGCNGATVYAYERFMAAGTSGVGEMTHEHEDKYRGTEPSLTCNGKAGVYHAGAKVNDYWRKSRTVTDDEMKGLIFEHGAVASSVRAGVPEFMNYAGGIIDSAPECTDGKTDHAIVLVGYDRAADGTWYWIGKNSWGTGWGEAGFFRIKFGLCGIARDAAVVKCTQSGKAEAEPTKPAPPKADSCDCSSCYGSGITGDYILTMNSIRSEVSCSNTQCKPSKVDYVNACVQICGAEKCCPPRN